MGNVKPSYREAIKVVRQAKKAQKTARKCRRKLLSNPGASYQQKQSWKYHIARSMKICPTRCEEILGQALRSSGKWRVRTQVQIGPYIADFLLEDERVVVEADGSVHQARKEYDLARDKYMTAKGYRVIRLSNKEISATNGSIEKIESFLESSE